MNDRSHETPTKHSRLDWQDEDVRGCYETCAIGLRGIMLAGGCFPLVAACLYITCLYLSGELLSLQSEVPLVVFLCLTIGFIFGSLYGLLSGAIAALIVACFNSSINCLLNARTQIVITSGLAGFCSTWLTFHLTDISNPTQYAAIALAMVMGHVSAVYWGLDESYWFDAERRTQPTREPSNRLQFQVRHCFIVTAWIAGILAISRMYTPIQFAVMLFATFQATLLTADYLYLRATTRRS